MQGLLRLNADAEMARGIFARIVELHKSIEEAIAIG